MTATPTINGGVNDIHPDLYSESVHQKSGEEKIIVHHFIRFHSGSDNSNYPIELNPVAVAIPHAFDTACGNVVYRCHTFDTPLVPYLSQLSSDILA